MQIWLTFLGFPSSGEFLNHKFALPIDDDLPEAAAEAAKFAAILAAA